MILGRNPRNPVIGTIVDTDAIRYKVYWCNAAGELAWHARCELAVPRLDYGRGWQ